MNSKGKFIALTAMLAGVYFVSTVALAPLSYGPIQLRISEILTLLAFFNPAFVPGLVIGCFLANLTSPYVLDLIVGTLATFLAVYPMVRCKNIFLASLLPVISNGLLIGIMISVLTGAPWWISVASVAGSEFLTVSVLGIGIVKAIEKIYPMDRLRTVL